MTTDSWLSYTQESGEWQKRTSCCENDSIDARPDPVDRVTKLFFQQRRFNAQSIAARNTPNRMAYEEVTILIHS